MKTSRNQYDISQYLSSSIQLRKCIIIMSKLDVLEHQISGNLQSSTLLVFVQGWPDSLDMWEYYMAVSTELKDFRILKINFPNYGQEKIAWGQDFPVIVDRLKATIDSVAGIEKRVLICHDWGCMYGYLLDEKYPRFFSQIVSLDIPPKTELTLLGKISVLLYQIYLVIAFLIGGRIGEWMTKQFARILKHNPPYFSKIKSDRNFPYFYFWKNMIVRKLTGQKLFLYNYRPSVPMCFLYGEKNPFRWVGPAWTKYLKETEGCEIIPVASGHWFMKDYKNLVLDSIRRVARR